VTGWFLRIRSLAQVLDSGPINLDCAFGSATIPLSLDGKAISNRARTRRRLRVDMLILDSL
jgi:hypothetical protein